MQQATITKGPHILWKSNRNHYGIEVTSLKPDAELRKSGYCKTWKINATTFCDRTDNHNDLGLASFQEFLGLIEDEYNQIVDELTALEEEAINQMKA